MGNGKMVYLSEKEEIVLIWFATYDQLLPRTIIKNKSFP